MTLHINSGPHENEQKWPLYISLFGTFSRTGCQWAPVRSSWQLMPPTMISQFGATSRMLFPAVSAAFRQSYLDPSPQVGVPKSDFLTQFLRSMPMTLGLSLYLRARAIRHWKKSFSENLSLNHRPSPSLCEQHHCDTLVWLFSITISPSSVMAFTVQSKISAAVLPKRLGFSLISSRSMKLLSLKSCREKVRRTQFMPNFSRMSLHNPFRGRLSNPPTQCRFAWPPDQFPPASLTLRPVRSTMRMPEVESGNCMSATSKRGSCDVNSCWSCRYWPMSYGFLQWLVLPIIIQINSKKITSALSCLPNVNRLLLLGRSFLSCFPRRSNKKALHNRMPRLG